jgi:HlyD family secretion protein
MAAQLQQRNAVEANEADPTEATHKARLTADQAVAEAQAQLDALRAGPDEATLANAQEGVTAAAANVTAAQADMNRQLAGATTAQIAGAESQVAQAAASLANLTAGPTEAEIAAAEAELSRAQLSLSDAQERLARATVVASFPGVVAAVLVSPGEFVNGMVVELVGASGLEVVLEVDELDVGELSLGQSATVTLEAWPEVEIPAEVRSIAPGATTNRGTTLVTYEVHLGLGASDLPVRAGMTANASLVTAQRTDVLLVPNAAIQVDRQAGRYSVNLVVDGSVQEVPVTVGLHDDDHTQITGGIQEGDQVWIGEIEAGLFDSDGGGFLGQHP